MTTEQTEQTEAIRQANRDALGIQNGACNPRAMARALVRAIDASCDQGGSAAAGESPAVRLILHQLQFILYRREIYFGDWFPAGQWDQDMKACGYRDQE